MRSVCVFCGSNLGHRPMHADAARRLGTAMAERGLTLVYGGGHVGLMGVIADAVLAGGGTVVGVITRALVDKELAHTGLTELHITETMHQRKMLMADRADAFAALPGGYGTADEFFEILSWAQLKIHAKPVGLLNSGGFFDGLLRWIDHTVEEGYLRVKHRELLLVENDPLALLDRLAAWQPTPTAGKWLDRDVR